MSLPEPRPLRATRHCRHYSYKGGMTGGPKCGLGVDLRAGQPGMTFPCMPKDPADDRMAVGCDKRQDYTDDERAVWKAWMDRHIVRMANILAEIPGNSRDRKNRPEWGKSGSFPCPACKTDGAIVRWARSSYNGHVRAFCSTPECFEVIE